MTEIEWADPPQTFTDWASVAAQLRTNPGQWARIKAATADNSFAARVKSGVNAAFRPSGSFEARSVKVGDNLWDMYARFVGTQDGTR